MASQQPNLPNQSTLTVDSTTTVSSTTPLTSQPNRPQKDYAAALSTLQSRYGSGGSALPSPKVQPSNKLPSSASSSLNPSPLSTFSTARTPGATPGSSQMTLTTNSTSFSGTSGGSSASASGGSTSSATQQKKDKKTSVLRNLFKGKKKKNAPEADAGSQ
ncbi:hypothetical protein CPC08DRAFT_354460 [Agrocybe pediades]|nr:hypothetical protein CPC08DRAFT_354460 [Agrocybe pediades]